MVSGSGDDIETNLAFKAIDCGALTAIRKLPGLHDPNYESDLKNLLNTVRAMSAVRVIHRWKPEPASKSAAPTILPQIVAPQIVAIVASTGGPSALSDIIHHLPADFRLPIVIVQHITADFIPSLVDWLSSVTSLKVMIARQGDLPRPGSVYLAPGDAHLRLTKGLRFELNKSPDSMLHRPSGDIFLTSVAQAYAAQAIGIVLTGMGEDGAHGLRAMYDKGAYTIAQDEATSVVYGMPCRAAELGAVQQILPLSQIAGVLTKLAGQI
jgi:two-component system chemotaxis response regulator CheB